MTVPSPAEKAASEREAKGGESSRSVAKHDCGHVCCDSREDSFHGHFLPPDQCPPCVKGLSDSRALCSRQDCGQPLVDHDYGVFCP